ncbi:Copper transport protein CCH [Cucurbita argyrosperma subsp. argyrosperma]|nr:Copper transport protein CCH [Cucurbita argyrosperma subsp. argyrosperma]
MSQTTVLKVAMSCQGCVGAVRRVLGKLEGVETFDIDIDAQKVTVKGNVERDVVFQTVSKTGKKTAYWEDEATKKNKKRRKPSNWRPTKPQQTAQSPPPNKAKARTPHSKLHQTAVRKPPQKK